MSKRIREVKILDILSYFLLSLFLIILASLSMVVLWYKTKLFFWLLPVYIIIAYILLARFIIGLVLLYKAFAPLRVRHACRFTPTCSTYMIMAIQKYGLFRGVYKGFRRILRCKPPNGGVDYP